MPTVIIEAPKIDEDAKRKLVAEITRIVQEIYGIKYVTVVIHENIPECVGINGRLLSDIVKGRGGD